MATTLTPITGIKTAQGVHKIDYSALVNVPDIATSQEMKAIIDEAIEDALKNLPPAYDYGETDLVAGTSTLETGKVYFVYE